MRQVVLKTTKKFSNKIKLFMEIQWIAFYFNLYMFCSIKNIYINMFFENLKFLITLFEACFQRKY